MIDKLNNISLIFTSEGIDHAIIGGLALAAHGVQRFTNDIDFILDGENRLKVKSVLAAKGFKLHFESPDVLQFVGDVDVDIILANRPMSRAMLQNARVLKPFKVKTVGIEALIGLKIQAYCNNHKREYKDKGDIASLISSGQPIDWQLVQKYADLFGEWKAIQEIKEKMES